MSRGDNEAVAVCDDGWLDASLQGLGCLLFRNTNMTWWEANKYCQDHQSHLIEVLSPAQVEYLRMEMEIYEVWISVII